MPVQDTARAHGIYSLTTAVVGMPVLPRVCPTIGTIRGHRFRQTAKHSGQLPASVYDLVSPGRQGMYEQETAADNG